MSDVHSLINQQLGFKKWRTLDSALLRLRCVKRDEYKQILPAPDSTDSDTVDTPIFACKFAQSFGYEHLLALANEDGTVAIHNTDNGDRYGQQLHYNAIFDLAWMFQHMKLVTVSGDHSARLFDVANGEIRNERIFNGHTRSVKTVAFRKNDSAVFATGGRDGSVIVWDTRAAGHGSCFSYGDWPNVFPDRVIGNSHFVGTPSGKGKKRQGVTGANSVTGLAFQDDYTLVSCGSGDGAIKLWDLRKNYKLHKKEPTPKSIIPYCGKTNRKGFSNLLIDSSCIKLYANCLDNAIYCYNIGTCNPEPIMRYTGHQNSTFYVKSSLSADGSYIVSGSSDQSAYIWNVNNQHPLVKLNGHSAEVTCVAWRQKGDATIVTCSDDMKHKIWRIGPESLPENWEVIGCGTAERVGRTKEISCLVYHKRLKRLIQINDCVTQELKKHIKECVKCRCSTPNESVCENCTETSLKRKNPEPIVEETKRKAPRRLFTSPTSTADSKPLIDNLPNFVVDGCAPHLNYSPQKRKDRDWLTKLRVERSLLKEMQEFAGPSPSKVPKVESPRARGSRTPKSRCASPKSPLLRFFKVTNNPAKCDSSQQCSLKHNCALTG